MIAPGGPPTAESFLFGPFALDGYAGTLVSHDLAVPLQPKTFELLEYFVRNAGRVIPGDELLRAVWPGEGLSAESLLQQTTLLRATLARYSPRETYVIAEPDGGYRFVAPVAPREGTEALAGPEAERLYARGRYFCEKRTADALDRSMHYYRRAIERDESFGRAHAGLAAAYVLAAEFMLMRPTEAFPRAEAAAERALGLDAALSDAHVVLGHVACYYERDGARAEREYAAAVALSTNAATIVPRARFWCLVGRAAEAAEAVRGRLAAEPYSLILQTTLAVTSLFERNFDAGLAQLRSVLELDSEFAHARFYYAVALQLSGRDDEVIAVTGRPLPDGYEQQFLALRGSSLARLGRLAEARPLDGALRALTSRGRFVSCFNLAWFAIGTGEFDHAVGLLEAGFSERDPWLVYLPHYPLFDPLRGNRRFQALVQRVEAGFAEGH
jgi:DNA-binding winged helix-turn-helix (wHTH) protein